MSTQLTLAVYAGYTLTILVILLALPDVTNRARIEFFKEGGYLENAQLVLLLASSMLASIGAARRPAWTATFRLLALCSVLGIVRELDGPLKGALPGFGWKPFAVLVLVLMAVTAWRWRAELSEELATFLCTDAFAILWSGFVVTALIAQLIGHGNFLELILEDNYDRHYKRVVEEVAEASGYILILFGMVQALIRAPQTQRAAPAPANPR